jgi:hypothetical protein
MKGLCRLAALLFILVAMLPAPKAAFAIIRCETLQGQPCAHAGTTTGCVWSFGTPEQRAGSCICEPLTPSSQPWVCA